MVVPVAAMRAAVGPELQSSTAEIAALIAAELAASAAILLRLPLTIPNFGLSPQPSSTQEL